MAVSPPLFSLTRFLQDERGSVSIETVILFPLLAWAFLALFVFFDAYRAKFINVRAAYTIGDVLSRETGYVTPEVLDSLYALQGVLNNTDQPRSLRITTFSYEEATKSFKVRWSQTRGHAAGELTHASLADLHSALPVMADGAWAVLTETWVDYRPDFTIGLKPFTFRNLAVTNLRFTTRLCWNSANDGGPETEAC